MGLCASVGRDERQIWKVDSKRIVFCILGGIDAWTVYSQMMTRNNQKINWKKRPKRKYHDACKYLVAQVNDGAWLELNLWHDANDVYNKGRGVLLKEAKETVGGPGDLTGVSGDLF